MPIRRLGVTMSALKAGIVDMVARGGDDGTPVGAIFDALFGNRKASRDTLKTHVWQINALIEAEGYRIVGVREHNQSYAYDRYRLIRVKARAA
jgi:hypothetical protein